MGPAYTHKQSHSGTTPKVVIFDLLTALLDSWSLWDVAAGNNPTSGRNWRSRYLELTFGCGVYQPYEDLVRESARDVGLSDAAPTTLLAHWDELQPWSEAVDVLNQLRKRGYRVGVITNCSRDLGQRAASRCGVAFDAVVTAEDARFYKPHREAYAAILADMKVNASEALFVAGSSGDVIGAAAVGMPVVWHNRVGLAALPGSAPLAEGQSLRSVLRHLVGSRGMERSEIPTPSLFLNRQTFMRNCELMRKGAEVLNARLRVHIKTHKTVEGTALEVSHTDGRIACSTLKEIEHMEPLIRAQVVKSVLYAIPPAKSSLQRLIDLRRRLGVEFILMIDHPTQINLLSQLPVQEPWQIFINVDCGSRREGLPPDSADLHSLIEFAVKSTATVRIYGFYCHSGHSYGSNSLQEAETHLLHEISCADAAARICVQLQHQHQHLTATATTDMKLTLSVGATPTAHAASAKVVAKLSNLAGNLELHAGNYAILDLQQVSTGLVAMDRVASWVEADILSVYPHRGEVLINIGSLGLGREPGREQGVWGRAKIVVQERRRTTDTENKEQDDYEDEEAGYAWNVVRISQEHGILAPRSTDERVQNEMISAVEVGSRVRIIPQHACITGAMYDSYIVVDEEDGLCVDEWQRCRGW